MAQSLDLELSSSQYASRVDNASLSITGDFSVEGWGKIEQLPSTAGTSFMIVGKSDKYTDSTESSYYFEITNTDKLHCTFSDDGQEDVAGSLSSVNSTAAVVAGGDVGAWVHFAVTVDVSGPTFVLYKNSSPIAQTAGFTNATSIYDGTATFKVGAIYDIAQSFFDGKLFDCRLWSDIRSGAEISTNYQKYVASNEAGLVSNWKFNNNYLDEHANSNDLTSSGSPIFSGDVPDWAKRNPAILRNFI